MSIIEHQSQLLIDVSASGVGTAVSWIEDRGSEYFIGLSTVETCF